MAQVKVKAWNSFSAIDQDAGNITVDCLPESNDSQNSVGFFFPSKIHIGLLIIVVPKLAMHRTYADLNLSHCYLTLHLLLDRGASQNSKIQC